MAIIERVRRSILRLAPTKPLGEHTKELALRRRQGGPDKVANTGDDLVDARIR